MGSGFSKMKKQKKMLQEQFEKLQEELKNTEYKGISAGGLVQIVLSGNHEMKSITINPECVDKNDVEGLQDLILTAFKEAHAQASANSPMGDLDTSMFSL